MYFVYTSSETTPEISNALGDPTVRSGVSIETLLNSVASALRMVLDSGSKDNPIEIDDEGGDTVMDEEDEEEYDIDMDDDYNPTFGGFSLRLPLQHEETRPEPASRFSSQAADAMTKRIREDLLTAREAGFKVGVLGSPMHAKQSYISLSCRIAKLGISDEAMLAWHLEKNHYLILLIQYSSGYKTTETIAERTSSFARLSVEFRVGTSASYKPSLTEATNAFAASPKGKAKIDPPPDMSPNGTVGDKNTPPRCSGFSEIFIGKPLTDLLNERFAFLLKTRITLGLSWNGAENYINDIQVSSILIPLTTNLF